jgi:hypothetical protein
MFSAKENRRQLPPVFPILAYVNKAKNASSLSTNASAELLHYDDQETL